MDYLIGLLIGDYILQSDWEANNKQWKNRRWLGLLIALFHGALVTLSIYGCGYAVGRRWPWWCVLILWITHSVQDWLRLPQLMMQWRGQFKHFQEHFPGTYITFVIVVDNVWHLALLFALSLLC